MPYSAEDKILYRRSITDLVNTGFTDKEIGNNLDLSILSVKYLKKILKIRRRFLGNIRMMQIICNVINSEHPLYCLCDYQVMAKMKKLGFSICVRTIFLIRKSLGIPPAYGRGRRQLLYFRKGRMIWSADGKHALKPKRSVYDRH